MTAKEKQRVIKDVEKIIETTLPDYFDMGQDAGTVADKKKFWLAFATDKIEGFFSINEGNRQN